MTKKKPVKEVLVELTEQPYKYFAEVDYQRIMSLKVDGIKIDTHGEQTKFTNKKSAGEHPPDDNDSHMEDSDEDACLDKVHVCGLIIDIESISKQDILKLRKLMPKKDYR